MSRRTAALTLVVALLIGWGSAVALALTNNPPPGGIDMAGAASVVLVAAEGTDRATLESTAELIRRRLTAIESIQEPQVWVQGDGTIVVQVPDVPGAGQALAAAGRMGAVSFRPILAADFTSPAFTDGTLPNPNPTTTLAPDQGDGSDSPSTTSTPDDESEAGTEQTTTTTAAPATTTAAPPIPDNLDPEAGLTIADDPTQGAYLPSDAGLIYSVGPAFITGDDMVGAEVRFVRGLGGGGYAIRPTFTDEAAGRFEAATAQMSIFPAGDPRRAMAIVIDGVVVSAPSIGEDVAPGQALPADNAYITMTGSGTPRVDAEALAGIVAHGRLPVELTPVRTAALSAGIGGDVLRSAIVWLAVGAVLAALVLLAFYRALGLVAVVGLLLYAALVWTASLTLHNLRGNVVTLALLSGVAVALVMAVDSFVLSFERMREELWRGRPARTAAEQGSRRALRAKLTAGTVVVAGSVGLWLFGGAVLAPFASTLAAVVLADLLVTRFYTRPAMVLLARSRLGEHGTLGIPATLGDPAATATAEVAP